MQEEISREKKKKKFNRKKYNAEINKMKSFLDDSVEKEFQKIEKKQLKKDKVKKKKVKPVETSVNEESADELAIFEQQKQEFQKEQGIVDEKVGFFQKIKNKRADSKAEKLYKEAYASSNVASYVQALRLIQQAVELKPTVPKYRSELGVLNFRLENYVKALENFDLALDLGSKVSDWEPYSILKFAETCHKLGQKERTLNIALESEDIQVLRKVGELFESSSDYENEEIVLKKSIEIEPRYGTREDLCFFYFRHKEFEKAFETAEHFCHKKGLANKLLFRLGQKFIESEDYGYAIKSFQKCLDLKYGWEAPQVLLSQAYLRNGEKEKALEKILKISSSYIGDGVPQDTSEFLEEIQKEFEAAGDDEKVIQCLEKAVELEPENYASNKNLCFKLLENGETEKIFDVAENFEKNTEPEYAENLYEELSKEFEKKEDSENYIKTLEKLVEVIPNYIDYKKLAFAYLNKGESEKAIETIVNSKLDESSDFQVGDKIRMNAKANEKYGLPQKGSGGVILRYVGEEAYTVKFTNLIGDKEYEEETCDVHQECIEKLSKEGTSLAKAKILAELNKEFKEKEDSENSIKCLEKLVELNPEKFDYIEELAFGYVTVGENDKAIETAKRFERICVALSEEFEKREDYSNAIKTYEKIPVRSGLHNWSDLISLHLKDKNLAKVFELADELPYELQELAEKFVELDDKPNAVKSFCEAGKYFVEDEDNDEAVEVFEKAVEVDPEFYLGDDKYRLLFSKALEEEEGCEEALEPLLKLEDPGYAMPLNFLGEKLKGKNNEAALKAFKKAVEFEPDARLYRLNLVDVLFDLKERDTILEEVIKFNDADLLFGLGEKFYKAKDYPNAIKTFEKVIELNPWSGPHIKLKNIYLELGENDKALEEIIKIERVDLLDKLGKKFYEDKDYPNAIKAFEKMVELDNLSEPQIELSKIYLELDENEKAFEEILKINDGLTERSALLEELSEKFEKLEDYANAAKALEIIFENFQRHSEWNEGHQRERLSNFYFKKLGDYSKAIEMTDDVNFLEEVIREVEEKEDSENIIKGYEKLVDLDKTNPRQVIGFVRTLFTYNQSEKAKKLAEEKESPRIWHEVGEWFFFSGEDEEAAECFRKANRINNDSELWGLHNNWGENQECLVKSLLKSGRDEEAKIVQENIDEIIEARTKQSNKLKELVEGAEQRLFETSGIKEESKTEKSEETENTYYFPHTFESLEKAREFLLKTEEPNLTGKIYSFEEKYYFLGYTDKDRGINLNDDQILEIAGIEKPKYQKQGDKTEKVESEFYDLEALDEYVDEVKENNESQYKKDLEDDLQLEKQTEEPKTEKVEQTEKKKFIVKTQWHCDGNADPYFVEVSEGEDFDIEAANKEEAKDIFKKSETEFTWDNGYKLKKKEESETEVSEKSDIKSLNDRLQSYEINKKEIIKEVFREAIKEYTSQTKEERRKKELDRFVEQKIASLEDLLDVPKPERKKPKVFFKAIKYCGFDTEVKLYEKGKNLIDAGEYEKGIEKIEKAIEIEKSIRPSGVNSDKLITLSEAYCKIGEYDQAYHILKEFSNKDIYTDNFISACSKLPADKAIDLLKRKTEKVRDSYYRSKYWEAISEKYMEQEDYYGAVYAFAKREDKSNILDACQKAEDPEKALALLKKLSENDLDLTIIYCDVCKELGDDQDVIESYESLIELNPKTSYYHDLRDLHQKLGNQEKVIETCEALIEFDPKVSNYTDLCQIYQNFGNQEKVIETYEALIEFDPQVSHYTDLCNFYQELGDEEKVVETARKALDNADFDKDADLHMNNFFAIIQEYERKNDDVEPIDFDKEVQ